MTGATTSGPAANPTDRGARALRDRPTRFVARRLAVGRIAGPIRPRWTARSALLELVGLAGLAITQPLLDVFGKAPEVFVQSGASRSDVVLFAVAVALAPAVVLLLVELATGTVGGVTTRAITHALALAVLVALLTIQAGRGATSLDGASLLALALVLGGVFAIAYLRLLWVQQWLRYSAIGVPFVVALFLFASPANALLRATGATARTGVAVDAGDRGPIVVLILDELPVRSLLDADGRIDDERFPGFGALAAESTWYRNTTSVATHTMHAVPAILTGRYPGTESLPPTAAVHPDNVFRLLERAYRFNVVEEQTDLCVVGRCSPDHPDNAPAREFRTPGAPMRSDAGGRGAWAALFEQTVDAYAAMIDVDGRTIAPEAEEDRRVDDRLVIPEPLPGADDAAGNPANRTAQPADFAAWLGTIDADTDTPQLSVLHTVLPHNPWYLDGEGVAYSIPEGSANLVGLRELRWLDAPGATEVARQRHLLAVRYTDTLVAALHAHLEALGIWDTATVIVTADHGAAFEPGGYFRRWEAANSPEIAGVPLFVHGPGFASGTIVDEPAQTVDVLPTVAQVAAVDVPWGLDGTSLLELPAQPRWSHPYAKAKDETARYRVEPLDVRDHLTRLLALARGTTGGGDLAVLRGGPDGDLVGDQVTAVARGPDATGSVDLDFPSHRDGKTDGWRIDEHGRVPALLIGRLHDRDLDAPIAIAVAIDGRIAAVVRTFAGDDDRAHPDRFTALLPPSWLASGSHRVTFYELTGVGDRRRLLPLDS